MSDSGIQKTIAYYISDYGFGHATRSLAVIRRLCCRSGIRIIICNAFAYEFLNQSLADLIGLGKVSIRKVSNDIGYVLKPQSLVPDRNALKIKYTSFISDLHSTIQREVKFLRNHRVDLVIGDIPPVPFKAAQMLLVPSIGISNFTWATAYEDLLTGLELQPLRDCYSCMDYFFALAGSKEPLWGKKGNRSFGFFSRRPEREAVMKIRKAVNPLGSKTIVFFGLGMKIDTENLASYRLWHSKNCVFLVSSNTKIKGSDIHQIPANDTESQNYVAASDIILTKPGWGTVAEAVSYNKFLILVTRDQMPEDTHTIQVLQNDGGCELVGWENMKNFEITADLLKKLESQKRPLIAKSEDVLTVLAEAICSILFHGRISER